MTPHLLLRLGILAFGAALLLLDRPRADARGPGALVRAGIAALALADLVVLVALVAGHLRSPFENELMEFTVLQHASRLFHGLPVYPDPGPGFVALAYNPLYYVVAVPFLALLGENLLALRTLSLLAFAGCLLTVFLAVRGRARSAWWGLVALGLFAGAYKAMDAYLDTAHSDGWMLLCALVGTWALERARGAAGRVAAALLLVAAFWFKQHGALFALGGLAFLTLRDGWRRAAPAWIAAALLGPLLYAAGGDALFGPAFHRFTWDVPRSWSSLDLETAGRLVTFVALWYPVLAVTAGLTGWLELRRLGRGVDAWTFQLAPAVLSGAMGALDAGSSNNVFIPMGVWFVLLGTIGLSRLGGGWTERTRIQPALVVVSFALLAFNPLPLVVPAGAAGAEADLVRMARGLPGTVYAPWIGALPAGYRFTPAAHVVALEDWIGRHGRGDEPGLAQAMEPALRPAGEAWVIANTRLESYACFTPLAAKYRLARDFGDRFSDLRCVPRRWSQAWPRYLYRYAPLSAASPPADAPRSWEPGARRSPRNARPRVAATGAAGNP